MSERKTRFFAVDPSSGRAPSAPARQGQEWE
jgi:hypothetical protein